ncbi:MAG: hypothetical protein Q3998_04480 [Porphyromonas sp.]|nr:hypothetical protein [Porphyromonas sp.]
MKNRIKLLFATLFVVIASLTVSGCGSVSSIHGGQSDDAYLVVSSAEYYAGEVVAVEIDGVHVGNLEVVKKKNVVKTKSRLTIKPGRHSLILRDLNSGRVLKELEIFVSTRSSKVVELP